MAMRVTPTATADPPGLVAGAFPRGCVCSGLASALRYHGAALFPIKANQSRGWDAKPRAWKWFPGSRVAEEKVRRTMRTVWDVNTALDCFPVRLSPVHDSVPTKAETVRAIHQMLDTLVHEPRALIIDTAALVADFNALLEQVKDQFPGSDTLRLIEPLDVDASA